MSNKKSSLTVLFHCTYNVAHKSNYSNQLICYNLLSLCLIPRTVLYRVIIKATTIHADLNNNLIEFNQIMKDLTIPMKLV